VASSGLTSSRTEIAALDVFARAESAGEQITLAMCERRLEELRSHPPTCRCAHNCADAAKAKPHNVYAAVARWQRWAARQRGGPRARRARIGNKLPKL
jgi:hypothetical protein